MAAGTALRIGLTGGIGSGKSTVAELLHRRGAALVDTDLIARQLSEPGGAAIDALRDAFGSEVLTEVGGLDRARMRAIAFADAEVRHRLEAIMHPLIGREAERQATAARAPLIVFDIPLLVESNQWPALVDRIWVVDCREATQIARVSARQGWDEAMAAAVIAQQASRLARRRRADAVIYNDGITLEDLSSQVAALWQQALL